MSEIECIASIGGANGGARAHRINLPNFARDTVTTATRIKKRFNMTYCLKQRVLHRPYTRSVNNLRFSVYERHTLKVVLLDSSSGSNSSSSNSSSGGNMSKPLMYSILSVAVEITFRTYGKTSKSSETEV